MKRTEKKILKMLMMIIKIRSLKDFRVSNKFNFMGSKNKLF